MKTPHPSLSLLLERIEFSQHDPASVQDTTHRVFVMPRPSERAEHFDALVTITPHDPDAAPPAGETLTALPRVATPPTPVVEAETNASGQAWLRELPFGDYGLVCGDAALLDLEEVRAALLPDRNAVAGDGSLALAAKSGPAGIITCRTGDSRVSVWIETGSQPRIRARANDPSLATATLRFRLGRETIDCRLDQGHGNASLATDAVPKTPSISLDDFEVQI